MNYQRDFLARFPEQIRYAVANYKPHTVRAEEIDNVLLGGLGGSGIAGRIIKSYFNPIFPKPVEVVSDYGVPAFVDRNTLVILSSYSGGTEETLSMYDAAKERGARIIVIATGGKLVEKAKADGQIIYYPETGFQPRMALGYSLTYLFMIFGELTSNDQSASLLQAADELGNEDMYIQQAQQLFGQFKQEYPKKIVSVTDNLTYPVGVRFSQQLEENAKAQAFVHILPEANHNVIESYYGNMDSIFIFLNSHLNARVDLRFSFLAELLRSKGNTVLQLDVEKNTIPGLLKAIYVLDWLSLIVADFKGVNSSLIENINALKEYLAGR